MNTIVKNVLDRIDFANRICNDSKRLAVSLKDKMRAKNKFNYILIDETSKEILKDTLTNPSDKEDLEDILNSVKNAAKMLERNGIKDILGGLEAAITLNYTEDYHLLDKYNSIAYFLFNLCELNQHEVGFIFNKIMKYNFRVNSFKDTVIITYESFIEKGMSKEEASVLLKKHSNDDLTNDEQKLIDEIIEVEKNKTEFIKESYKFIEEFSQKHTHSESEYESLTAYLKSLHVTSRLIDSYILYFKKREKEEVKSYIKKPKEIKKKEVIPSRRELKNKLNELYHPEEKEEYFNIKDLNEVLMIIKLLSISDERAEIILNDLYRCVIKNREYYEFLLKKVEYMKMYRDKLSEINELKEMLEYEDMEAEANIMLEEIYDSMSYAMINSFDYEASLRKKL